MTSLPDLESLIGFTHQEVLYDSLVKQSIEAGYMTEAELLIARYIQEYCNVQCPEDPESEYEIYLEKWKSHLPAAYDAAAQQFSVTPQRAQELYNQSLKIRNRIIQRMQGD